MSNVNEGFDYLCNQFKNGIVVGAGLTLFSSGIIIGFKAASFIVDIAGDIGSDGIQVFKEKIQEILEEDDEKYEERQQNHKRRRNTKTHKENMGDFSE